MTKNKTLVVFNTDLRTQDNPALSHATADGAVIALYVLDHVTDRELGGASKWWLHHSLKNLAEALDKLNIQLVLRRGNRVTQVQELVKEADISRVFWNRNYDRSGVAFGAAVKTWAATQQIEAESFNANLLHEPAHMKTKTGGHFKVFTPFWKNYLAQNETRDIFPPATIAEPMSGVASDKLTDWDLLPISPNWAEDFQPHWQPGETGAHDALRLFLEKRMAQYAQGRDVPSQENTSALSPHLRFGEISPTQIWHETKKNSQQAGLVNADKFLAEIGWREFAHHLLFHNQDLATRNFNGQFDHFPWNDDEDKDRLLQAWQRGQTGYPIVDAGMRQLWQTGWMHNRVRMIVGSFLVKHLLIDWREGERWFWDTLLDACPANNTASWQWIAGCGADAAPYFRIFNPVLQGEKFDTNGDYVRKYVPELTKLPKKLIHKPWTARAEELKICGVLLGQTYPHPVVEHSFARDRALRAFDHTKTKAA